MGQLVEQEVWEAKAFQELVSKEQKETGLTYEQLWYLLDGMQFNRAFYTMAIGDILQGCSYSIVKDLHCGSWVRVH